MRRTLLIPLLALPFLMGAACHGRLPPTQPPRNISEDPPATRTNDLAPGPIAGEHAPPTTPVPVTPAPPSMGGGTGSAR